MGKRGEETMGEMGRGEETVGGGGEGGREKGRHKRGRHDGPWHPPKYSMNMPDTVMPRHTSTRLSWFSDPKGST